MATISSTEHERLLRDYVDLWNGDGSNLDTVSESVVIHDPGVEEPIRGRDAFEAYLDELRTGFPDFHVAIDDVLDDDETVMAEWTMTGTHEGEFEGMPATDREVKLTGMDKLLIADGKVQEHRIHYDVREMFEQLGIGED